MSLCDQLRQVSLPVFLVVMLFSMSTWIDVVSIWVELPLLVNVLPEGWDLPAYLTIIIQCANIGPAVYALVYKIRCQSPTNRPNSYLKFGKHYIGIDVFISFLIIIIATFSVMFMCFFWKYTVVVAGSPHSVPLFVLVCSTALVSCMSSVVFLPYMARFNTVYISAYYIGQGLSGLIPGLVGLMQGIGQEPICINSTDSNFSIINDSTHPHLIPFYKPPLFSVEAYFGFIVFLLCISLLAFYILNFANFCKKEMIRSNMLANGSLEIRGSSDSAALATDATNKDRHPSVVAPEVEIDDRLNADVNCLITEAQITKAGECNTQNEESQHILMPKPFIQRSRFILLLVTIGLVSSMTNGILPATQSYTCLPFGSLVYTLSLRLSSVASPLASLSSMFFPRPSLKVVVFLTTVGLSVSAFHLTLATQSPTPVLKGQLAGDIIVIVTSVVMAAAFSFVRVSVAAILRDGGSRRELLWCGGITQVGSFCGALVTFIFVQVFHVFTSITPCS